MAGPRSSFARRALVLQVLVVTLVVAAALTLFGALLLREVTAQYGERARAVAHAVSADPAIVAAVAASDPGVAPSPSGLVQRRAEAIRRRTGVLFVVVTDRRGVRLSHPNPAEVGRPVSTDPGQALAGREVVTVERGTLGVSARAKVPLRDAAGDVVGIVSVGIATDDIRAYWWEVLGPAALFAVLSLALGAVGSVLLTRHLRRLTLGLEPEELAELVQEREAVLHGIGEGVLAVDAAGRVSVCNDETGRLLGVRPQVGDLVDDLDLAPGVRAVLAGDDADDVVTLAGDRVLVTTRRRVRHAGRDLGSVVTLQDRTDLEALTRELDAVRALTEGLRAQQHEFSNRLHTIAGLLEIGRTDEAVDYLRGLSVPAARLGPGSALVGDPYLSALLIAKSAVAAEKHVRLTLGEDSWLPPRLVDPVEVITVVGNLVDNAVEAALCGAARPAWVDVILAADGADLHVSVADSGDGVAPAVRGDVFGHGVTTRAAGHGLGLALARRAARRLGGDAWMASPGGRDDADGPVAAGAVFAARLPGVLAAVPPAAAATGAAEVRP